MRDILQHWRVTTKAHPCPLCGHKGWCLVSRNGDVCICPYVADGEIKDLGDAGHLHRLRESDRHTRIPWRHDDKQRDDAEDVGMIEWLPITKQLVEDDTLLAQLADALAVDTDALRRLRTRFTPRRRYACWPMCNAKGITIGYRVRPDHGKKFALTTLTHASKNGLFCPTGIPVPCKRLIVCEGPTDTAAVLSMGFEAIGRPNCSARLDMTCQWIAYRKARSVIIIADADGPGHVGACKLADKLWRRTRELKVIYPPRNNDVRDWRANGCDHERLAGLIDSALDYNPERHRKLFDRFLLKR